MTRLAWHVADMLELPFDSASFDAVIEKGTMDVLFVDNDSPWSPPPKVCARVARMLDETHRCNPLFLCFPSQDLLSCCCMPVLLAGLALMFVSLSVARCPPFPFTRHHPLLAYNQGGDLGK